MRLAIVLLFVLSCGGSYPVATAPIDAGAPTVDAGEVDAGIDVDAGTPCHITLTPSSTTYPVGSTHVTIVGTYTQCTTAVVSIHSAKFYDATGETRDVTTGSPDCILTQTPNKWQVDMVMQGTENKMVLVIDLDDGSATDEQTYTFLLQ